jgi:hypothetical protein
MQRNFDISRSEVVELLQRKRRHGRSLTGVELNNLLERSHAEELEKMSSEALLSSSALRTS